MVHCPLCAKPTTPVPTPEEAPVGGRETVYGLTKVDQEKTGAPVGQAGRLSPTVALRYFLHVRGRARASSTRTRVSSPSSARACSTTCRARAVRGRRANARFLLRARTSRARQLAGGRARRARRPAGSTWGSGQGAPIREVAEQISEALGIKIAPEINGEFRPGEMRHLTSGTQRIRDAVGYAPQTDLLTGGRQVPGVDSHAGGGREGLLLRGGAVAQDEGHRAQGGKVRHGAEDARGIICPCTIIETLSIPMRRPASSPRSMSPHQTAPFPFNFLYRWINTEPDHALAMICAGRANHRRRHHAGRARRWTAGGFALRAWRNDARHD